MQFDHPIFHPPQINIAIPTIPCHSLKGAGGDLHATLLGNPARGARSYQDSPHPTVRSPVRYPPARHPTAEGQARCERASPTPHDHRRHATARNQRTGTPHSLVEESFSSERGTAIPSLGSHACIRNRRPTPTRRHHSNSQPFTLQTPTTPHRKTQRNPRRELNKMLRRGINATDLDHSARGAALSLRCVG